jgi:hypothetical protein
MLMVMILEMIWRMILQNTVTGLFYGWAFAYPKSFLIQRTLTWGKHCPWRCQCNFWIKFSFHIYLPRFYQLFYRSLSLRILNNLIYWSSCHCSSRLWRTTSYILVTWAFKRAQIRWRRYHGFRLFDLNRFFPFLDLSLSFLGRILLFVSYFRIFYFCHSIRSCVQWRSFFLLSRFIFHFDSRRQGNKVLFFLFNIFGYI